MIFHDAHNHFQDEWLEPHWERIAERWLAMVGEGGRMVVNGTHPKDWSRVEELAGRFAFIVPSYGLHPWDVGAPRPVDWLGQLRVRLLAEPRAAVGEIGVDRWILDSAAPDDPRLVGVRRASLDEQGEVFLAQVALAAELGRVASVHVLHAHAEALALLRAAPRLPVRGFLLHAYGGPAQLVDAWVGLGAYFSFNTSFLDPRKKSRAEAFRRVPADRLLCETDAPAMPPPQAWRTHKLPPAPDGSVINHPGNIECAYAGLAALRGEAVESLAEQVAENFNRLFGC